MDEPVSDPHRSPGTHRRLVLVAGSGRSGTSVLACTLQALGMLVPGPEVEADRSNPRGFGESRWVVDFHDRLLKKANVRVADARPQAWLDAARVGTQDRHRDEVHSWLEQVFGTGHAEVVVKDPRISWFLPLWRAAALRLDIPYGVVLNLRAPSEVIGSKERYYPANVSSASRAAAWVNHMLHTERATRDAPRQFVRYSDLLDDFTLPVYRLGAVFDLTAVHGASARDLRRVHELIDPDLHRVQTTWDDVHIPRALQEIVDETWRQLNLLADSDAPGHPARDALDQVRREYIQLYEDAEAIAESSAVAGRRRKQTPQAPPPPAPKAAPADQATESQDSTRRRGLLWTGRRTG